MTGRITVGRVVEYFTVGSALIAGGLWLGSLNNRVQAGEGQLNDVSQQVKVMPTQVAILQTQMTNVQISLDDIKRAQEKQAEDARQIQQQILAEVRRR